MDTFLYNVYRARKTCQEMLFDRGYDTSKITDLSHDVFKKIINSNVIEIEKSSFITPVDLVVHLIEDNKTKKTNINLDIDSEFDLLSEQLEEISDEEDENEDYGVEESKIVSNMDSLRERDSINDESSGINYEQEETENKKMVDDIIKEEVEKTSSSELTGGNSIENLTEISEISSKMSSIDSTTSSHQTGGSIEITRKMCVVKFIFSKEQLKNCYENILEINNLKQVVFVMCLDDPKVFIPDENMRKHLAADFIKKDMENEHIQFFHYSQLIVNITKHKFVPKHELVDSSKYNSILKKYNIKHKQKLPGMLIMDPVCRYYNGKIGDIFKITRKDRFNGISIAYRCVHNPELDYDN